MRSSVSLALVLLAGCSAEPADPPNVLLITLDTLRADHLGCYGYDEPTSPFLDAFAERSTRYANARSTSPWTLPSHASLLTGLYPFEHGARTHEPQVVGGGPRERVTPLADAQTTMAEFLGGVGYETAAIVANQVYLSKNYRLDQGFDHYVVHRARWGEINDRAKSWLEGRSGEQPFFLFLNYMDVHRPYNTTPLADGRLTASQESSAQLLDRLYAAVMPGHGPIPTELVETIVAQYDLAIANLDLGLADLIAYLEQQGLFEDTVIVITSDHGEYFGEKHLVEHSKDIYEPGVRVPLLVKLPGQTAGRVEREPVSGVDVPHLVFAGFPAELRERAEATFPYRPGEHPVLTENHFTRLKDLVQPWGARFQRQRRSLHVDDYKFIHTEPAAAGAPELYDLARDPGETRNLAAERPDLAQQFELSLSEYVLERQGDPGSAEAVEISEELRAQMEALGYVESGGEGDARRSDEGN